VEQPGEFDVGGVQNPQITVGQPGTGCHGVAEGMHQPDDEKAAARPVVEPTVEGTVGDHHQGEPDHDDHESGRFIVDEQCQVLQCEQRCSDQRSPHGPVTLLQSRLHEAGPGDLLPQVVQEEVD
jgi:hypothetical protein